MQTFAKNVVGSFDDVTSLEKILSAVQKSIQADNSTGDRLWGHSETSGNIQ